MEAFRTAFRERDKGEEPMQSAVSGSGAVDGRMSLGQASISDVELQRIVTHDLGCLMNVVNLAAAIDLNGFSHVRRSILNYGFPDMVHRTIDEIGVDDIGDEILSVIASFEPRISSDSVSVRRDQSVEPESMKIRFVVSAELDAKPLKLPVQYVADLERDTGKMSIYRR